MPEKVSLASAFLPVVSCLSPASAFRHHGSVRYCRSWISPAQPNYGFCLYKLITSCSPLNSFIKHHSFFKHHPFLKKVSKCENVIFGKITQDAERREAVPIRPQQRGTGVQWRHYHMEATLGEDTFYFCRPGNVQFFSQKKEKYDFFKFFLTFFL